MVLKDSIYSPAKEELHLALLSNILSTLSTFADKSDAVLLVCNVLTELTLEGNDPQGCARKMFVEKGLLKALVQALDKQKETEAIVKKGFQSVFVSEMLLSNM